MLVSLLHLPVRQALSAITEVIHSLLPRPDAAERPTRLATEVRKEVAARHGLNERDESEEARARLLETLTGELSALTLTGARSDEAKARLGNRGALPINQYEFTFTEQLRAWERRGVRRTEVEAIVQKPLKVEHLRFTGDTIDPTQRTMSMLVGAPEDSSAGRSTVLLCGSRKNSTIQIEAAWRLFHDDIQITGYEEPMDLLSQFVHVYGTVVRVNQRPPRKLIVDEVAPMDRIGSSLKPGVPYASIYFDHDPTGHYEAFVLQRLSPLGVVHIALAFAIDVLKYEKAMRRHGVSIISL